MKDELSMIVFGGGCFWCIEAVFQRLKGVKNVSPGYTGGKSVNPTYREVCSGLSGHNEVVKIEYDESVISFKQLLDVFFSSHDPTTLNRQGNDKGTQYRSGIYFSNNRQKSIAEKYISETALNFWDEPIVTELVPLDVFYEAEKHHLAYYNNNAEQAYCKLIINPKIQKLKSNYHKLLKDEQA